MILAILSFSFLVLLVALGAAKSEPWKSSRDIINAKWLEDSAKFRLVSRWGIMR
jgi:hypothetical protein